MQLVGRPMVGARRGIAAAATRIRRLSRAILVLLSLALLVVAVAQGRTGQQTEVTLHLLVSPQGTIEVTANPGGPGICEDTSQTCDLKYNAGTAVHLVAREFDSTHPFYGWTTDECPATNECDLMLTGEEPDRSVFALFEQPEIVVVVEGPGVVAWPGGQCDSNVGTCATGPLPARTPVEFTATPGVGAKPTRWEFGCEQVEGEPNKCIARPENRNLGVSFNETSPKAPFEVEAWLRVGRTGAGSGRVTGSEFDCGSGDGCRKRFGFGKLVTLHAEETSGSRFDGWVGVCGTNPTCRFSVGPVTSVKARFVVAPPPPPPSPPPPPPPKLQVQLTKLTGFRRAGRWHVTARIRSNKPVSARALVGRKRRTWGNRAANLRAGSSSLTIRLARRATRGRCWFRLTAKTAEGESKVLPQRVVRLGH